MNIKTIPEMKWSAFPLLQLYTVPKEIDFLQYNMKCSGENMILRGIFHIYSNIIGTFQVI